MLNFAPVSSLSPIALFVFNRLGNTRRTLEALLANPLASESELYVFSDGGRDARSWREVRKVRRYLGRAKDDALGRGLLKAMTIVERQENLYVERNIMEGIAEVFAGHDRVIVLEDDILTSPHFLRYMNEALTLYASSPKVLHVSGFTNLRLEGERDYYFTPHMSGWGWATWRDKWQRHFRHFESRSEALQGMTKEDVDKMQYGGVFPCLKSLHKAPIPWDVCWELAIYKADGLCLTPSTTLVRNIGLTGGTHFRSCRLLQSYEYDRPPRQTPVRLSKEESPQAEEETERLFALAITDWGIRYTWLGRMIRKLYKRMRYEGTAG
ncbi:MAG: hypothetical protein LUC86_09130 [Prevotellaceae bacterium]|nr:hypothetical protein [Prevotellaceae bacterium]